MIEKLARIGLEACTAEPGERCLYPGIDEGWIGHEPAHRPTRSCRPIRIAFREDNQAQLDVIKLDLGSGGSPSPKKGRPRQASRCRARGSTSDRIALRFGRQATAITSSSTAPAARRSSASSMASDETSLPCSCLYESSRSRYLRPKGIRSGISPPTRSRVIAMLWPRCSNSST